MSGQVAVHRPSNGGGGSSEHSPLSDQQRQLLADRLFQAALENADKSHTPPDPTGSGEFTGKNAEHFAHAALYLTQAYMTAIQPRGTRK